MKREYSNISRIYTPPRIRVTDYCLEESILATSQLKYDVTVDELDNMNSYDDIDENFDFVF